TQRQESVLWFASECQAAAKLEGTRAAGAEDVRRSLRGLAKVRRVQYRVIVGEVGDVKDIETFAKDSQPYALLVQPEILGHANVLGIEAARQREVSGQRDGRDRVSQGICGSSVGLVELVHQLNQVALPFADAELVEAATGQRRSGIRTFAGGSEHAVAVQ